MYDDVSVKTLQCLQHGSAVITRGCSGSTGGSGYPDCRNIKASVVKKLPVDFSIGTDNVRKASRFMT